MVWKVITNNTPGDFAQEPVLSIAQNEISGLNVYPNPVSNGNSFISSDSNLAKSVEIYDILGKQAWIQLINAKVSNNAVNVSNLKGGAYIVRINEDGKSAIRKLIIE
jgi:Secretion system C-terminal sorting domain